MCVSTILFFFISKKSLSSFQLFCSFLISIPHTHTHFGTTYGRYRRRLACFSHMWTNYVVSVCVWLLHKKTRNALMHILCRVVVWFGNRFQCFIKSFFCMFGSFLIISEFQTFFIPHLISLSKFESFSYNSIGLIHNIRRHQKYWSFCFVLIWRFLARQELYKLFFFFFSHTHTHTELFNQSIHI